MRCGAGALGRDDRPEYGTTHRVDGLTARGTASRPCPSRSAGRGLPAPWWTRGWTTLALFLVLAWVAVPGAGTGALQAQEPQPVPTTTRPPLPEPLDISPGGAFLRAIAFPGWGHAAIGSHTRGAFYFGAQAATTYTLLRTRIRVGEAQDRVRFRENVLLQRLAQEGVTDPDAIQQRLDEDGTLEELRNLLDARAEQQEDLVAFGIFLLLLSGADAYVSAHLARFPDPLEVEARPGPQGIGTFDLGLRIRLPN